MSPEVSAFLKNMHETQGTKIHLDSKSLHLVEAPDRKVEVVIILNIASYLTVLW